MKQNRSTVNRCHNLLSPAVVVPIFLLLFIGCSKEVKKPVLCPPENAGPRNVIVPEYDEEGFISKNLFRVIIVHPGEYTDSNREYIKKIARMRAFSYMQKFLISHDRIVDATTRAKLLNLVDEHGKLHSPIKHTHNRCVFYFEIRREYLQEYLLDLSRKR